METIHSCASRVVPEDGSHFVGQLGLRIFVLGENELRLRGARGRRKPRGRSRVGFDVVEAQRAYLYGIVKSWLGRVVDVDVDFRRRGNDERRGRVGLADCVYGDLMLRQKVMRRWVLSRESKELEQQPHAPCDCRQLLC